ncbi:S1C family serine protease [Streptomyces sp. URMC 123]|uniref:S1C family serine protease n=1 Tax=Streptomyces sp. URMC 123 TaxID=3423403 RepID=UPI003F1A8D79
MKRAETMDPHPRHATRTTIVAGLCAATLLLGGCTGGEEKPTPRSPAAAAPSAATAAAPAGDLQAAYQKVVKEVLPSVVQITTGRELGSGVVYDAQGHVVTNAHVVGDAREFRVTLATGGSPHTARLVSSYPEQDLAVIKLTDVPQGLRPAAFGDSGRVEVGQIVLAMGNPLGLSSSVTQGIVSAVGRTVSGGREDGGTGATIGNMVQTSAAINPGNSGGALVGLDSKVIGIPTLAAVDPTLGEGPAPGIGFAIPASTVRTIADQIIRSGRVTESGRAALGITGRTVLGEGFAPAGVAVVEVARGGPAQRAGVAAGDVITGLGETDVATMSALAQALAGLRPGDTVPVRYERRGEERTASVTLGEM